jgi:hypothetical protein
MGRKLGYGGCCFERALLVVFFLVAYGWEFCGPMGGVIRDASSLAQIWAQTGRLK